MQCNDSNLLLCASAVQNHFGVWISVVVYVCFLNLQWTTYNVFDSLFILNYVCDMYDPFPKSSEKPPSRLWSDGQHLTLSFKFGMDHPLFVEWTNSAFNHSFHLFSISSQCELFEGYKILCIALRI